jgi:hypothetical protein
MSSTPPRNLNSNSNSGPPPLTRTSRVSGIIADDETPLVDLTPLPISFPSLEINANNNNQSLTSNAPLTSNSYLIDFEKQLKSSELSQQDKYDLILESDLSDEVKQKLIKTHIFDPKLLGKEVGGTKRRKTKRRKYKKNIIKKRKTKKRKYKK